MKTAILTIFILGISVAYAQPKDYNDDVKSVDAVVRSLYDVISGDPGQARDWTRFRNLFKPESRLIPTRKNESGELTLKALSPDEYIELFTARITSGFYEREIHSVVDTYGTVTHIFSTYETKDKKDGAATNRGINSIQLFYDGKRYYVINIFWCAESMGFPLPEKYLK